MAEDISQSVSETALEAAKRYLAGGLSVIPVRPNGSKKPAVGSWKQYQKRLPTPEEIEDIFDEGHGVAIIGGEVSGNLEILDFDAPELFQPWCELVRASRPTLLEAIPLVQTPSGGYHLPYRCEVIGRNQKLASEELTGPDGKPKVETLIETRAEGGYVVAPPSPAACHESGKPYVMLRGDLSAVPTIMPEERDILLSAARSFNSYVTEKDIVSGRISGKGEAVQSARRAGDDFNASGDWKDLLEAHGWRHMGQRGETHYWQRPGKEGDGNSATTNFVGSNLLFVFSSNAYPFEPGKAYNLFAAYAFLNHEGDFSAAAKALSKQGYGERGAAVSESPLDGGGDEVEADESWLNLGEFLDSDFPLVEEVMKHIEKGTLTQFCAPTNVGKTTLLLNASISVAAGQAFPPLIPEAGMPRRVLYVDFETGKGKFQETVRKMLSRPPYTSSDVLGLVRANLLPLVDTEVGLVPLVLSDERHLDYVQRRAQSFGADLIVIDNTSAGFQIESDNNNSEVAGRILLPLKNLAKRTGAAVILVHHTGKSTEGSRNTVDAMIGRGASNFANLSRTIYVLTPAKEIGEGFVVLHNTKNKGGKLLEPVTLRRDFQMLWHSQVQGARKVELTAESIRDYVDAANGATIGEIKRHFKALGYAETTIGRRADEAETAGLISRPNQKAKYRAVEAIKQEGAAQMHQVVQMPMRVAA